MMGYATIKRFLTAQMFQITLKIFKPRSCLWLVAVKNPFVSNDVQTFSENCEKNMTGTIFPGHVSITLARNFHFVAFITFSAGQSVSLSQFLFVIENIGFAQLIKTLLFYSTFFYRESCLDMFRLQILL